VESYWIQKFDCRANRNTMVVINNHTQYLVNIGTATNNSIKHDRTKSFHQGDDSTVVLSVDGTTIFECTPRCGYVHIINLDYQTPGLLARMLMQDVTQTIIDGCIIAVYSLPENRDVSGRWCLLRKVLVSILILLTIVGYISLAFISASIGTDDTASP
jgi:hypothetical protein